MSLVEVLLFIHHMFMHGKSFILYVAVKSKDMACASYVLLTDDSGVKMNLCNL